MGRQAARSQTAQGLPNAPPLTLSQKDEGDMHARIWNQDRESPKTLLQVRHRCQYSTVRRVARGVLDVKSISSNTDGSNENWFAGGDCRLLHLRILARLARCKVFDGTEVQER